MLFRSKTVIATPATISSSRLTVSYAFRSASMWSVAVVNPDGGSSSSAYVPVNEPVGRPIPEIPKLVAPGTVSGPGLILSSLRVPFRWNGEATATYYEVAARNLETGKLVVDRFTTVSSLDAYLLPDTTYRWNATACNAAGCSGYAAPLYFQTPRPQIVLPSPAIRSLSIKSVPADGKTRVLRISGENFVAGDVVRYRWFNPSGMNTEAATVVSGSQIDTLLNPGMVPDTIYVKVCESASSEVCSHEITISVVMLN